MKQVRWGMRVARRGKVDSPRSPPLSNKNTSPLPLGGRGLG